MTEIAELVGKTILDHFARVRSIDATEVVPTAHFFGDLDADSLDIIEIVFSLEEQFDRDILGDEMDDLVTVGDLVRLIEHKHGAPIADRLIDRDIERVAT